MNLASYIDHTVLKPGLLVADVEKACQEAKQFGFATVCIPPLFIKTAKRRLTDSPVGITTVIGFPFGYSAIEAKVAETLLAIVDGADELDVVINYTAIKNGDWGYIAGEINHLAPLIHRQGKKIKTILETSALTDEEIIRCCELYAVTEVDFVKTSTGYAEKGATLEGVQLMRRHLPHNIQIKAAGGIRTPAFALALVEAGATRLGCSNSVAVVQGSEGSANY